MRIRTTMAAALISGALIAGIGATPVMAVSPSGSSAVHATRSPLGGHASTGLERVAPVEGSVPIVGERPDHGGEAKDARVLPVVAAIAAAFVAAARAVPGLLRILKPFASKGASAFYAAVKAKAPGAVKVILAGVAGNAVYDRIKFLLAW